MSLNNLIQPIRRSSLTQVLAFSLVLCASHALALDYKTLPAGTFVLLEIQDTATSIEADHWAPYGSSKGEILNAVVWRDVRIEGRVMIHEGAGARVQILKLEESNMWGRAGELVVSALSVVSIDGQVIELGGAHTEKGRSQVWMNFIPLCPECVLLRPPNDVFLRNGSLLYGTVLEDTRIALPAGTSFAPEPESDELKVSILWEEFDHDKKAWNLPLQITQCSSRLANAQVVSLNGQPIDPLPIKILVNRIRSGCSAARAEVRGDRLSNKFYPGINWFEVESDGRVAEVYFIPGY